MKDTCKYIIRLLCRRPLRTFLAALQVALGVWAIALILSANININHQITEAGNKYGQNLFAVTAGVEGIDEDGSVNRTTRSMFDIGHIERLKESDNVLDTYIVENITMNFQLLSGEQRYRLQGLLGATSYFPSAAGIEIVAGNFFTEADVEQGTRVIVISESIANELFSSNPIGQTIQLLGAGAFRITSRGVEMGRQPLEFEVIGVFKDMDELQRVFVDWGHAIIPLGSQHEAMIGAGTSFNVRGNMQDGAWGGTTQGSTRGSFQIPESIETDLQGFTQIGMGAASTYRTIMVKSHPDRLHSAVNDVRVLLSNDLNAGEEIFIEYIKERDEDLFATVSRIILFFFAFSFIAVIISSVGILSLMLVSMIERTRDIGLHRALGATKRRIMFQFVVESVIVSGIGASLGLFLAAISARFVLEDLLLEAFWADLVPFQATLNPIAIVISIAIAILSGIIFAIYPAKEGANISPVEAIRG